MTERPTSGGSASSRSTRASRRASRPRPSTRSRVEVPWEDLAAGPDRRIPRGRRRRSGQRCLLLTRSISTSRTCWRRDGLAPSESNPQFHQQMVYAVAMTTIQHFERALGREALWADRRIATGRDGYDEQFVRRLRIYPHALRDRNAYY